jgi:two-component system, OmpR family, KDP operon response regulator KdpE
MFQERDLAIDFQARRVTMAGRQIQLLRREYELLRLLAEQAGTVLTNRQLLATVWGDAHRDDLELLRVHIRQLREKLGEDLHTPRYILTDPGNGYTLKVETL